MKNSKKAPLVAVHVSQNGIKLIQASDQIVLERMALHTIVEVVSYDDGFGNYNVVMLIQSSRNTQQCFLLQSVIGEEADDLCKQIRQAFTLVEKQQTTTTQQS